MLLLLFDINLVADYSLLLFALQFSLASCSELGLAGLKFSSLLIIILL